MVANGTMVAVANGTMVAKEKRLIRNSCHPVLRDSLIDRQTMTDLHEIWIAVLRLGCALAAGGILGWERELQDKPAGLRTNMLVALGSALLVLVSLRHSDTIDGIGFDSCPEASRVIQGIVGGIGFLGAGTILQSRRGVSGLTTASALWLSAAHGVASGLGYYVLTFVSVTLAVVVLAALGFVERAVFQTSSARQPAAPPQHMDESHADASEGRRGAG